MKRRILCVGLAAAAAFAFTACAADGDGGDTTVTTTFPTVEINTETLSPEEQAIVDAVVDSLPDMELENKVVKWLAHYDMNPNTASGTSRSIPLEMFAAKYGGSVEYYPTTWDSRYNDLSTMVIGGEGIDIFPNEDVGNLPGRIVSEMFQSVDPYIDLNHPLWQHVKTGMDLYKFGEKHYAFVTDLTATYVVFYNRETIENNGLEDPYDLWKSGGNDKWNWDVFRDMLLDFCDESLDQWGIDGYWNEQALLFSAGVPLTGIGADGKLVCNINDSTIEKAMTWQRGLFTDGLVFPREQFSYQERPSFMVDGRQLFYIIGSWAANGRPETWRFTIDPDDIMIAPVPSPAGSTQYQAVRTEGFTLCVGAGNPEGAARLAECYILSTLNESAQEIADRKKREEDGWRDELIEANREINELARLHPVLDISAGISIDYDSITTNGGDETGVRAPLNKGTEWSQIRSESADALFRLLADVQAKLDKLS
jgi:ABC-type glycerol-3-phosphate transport system substrate-binding protein